MVSKTTALPASHIPAYFEVLVGTCKASGEWVVFETEDLGAGAMRVRVSAITAYETR